MARLFDELTGDGLANGVVAPVTGAPFTVSAWARSNDLAVNQDVIGFRAGGVRSTLSFSGFDAGDFIEWRARNGGDQASAVTVTGFQANTWHHVCGIEVSSTDRRVFIDGGSKGVNGDLVVVSGFDETDIGAFSGDIGHVAVWDVALSDDEVASLASGASPLSIRRGSLVAYWPVNGQVIEPDIVGGVDLTVTGTVISEEPPIPHSIVAPGG